jgi:hypothetical protein
MGAWAYGPLDNDSALDAVYALAGIIDVPPAHRDDEDYDLDLLRADKPVEAEWVKLRLQQEEVWAEIRAGFDIRAGVLPGGCATWTRTAYLALGAVLLRLGVDIPEDVAQIVGDTVEYELEEAENDERYDAMLEFQEQFNGRSSGAPTQVTVTDLGTALAAHLAVGGVGLVNVNLT